MMFDWSDQDQVGDTIWAEFGGSEDHIVPYPSGTQDNNNNNDNNNNSNNNNNNPNNNNCRNYGNQDKNKQSQNSENKTDFEGCDMDIETKLDMESWPDLPSLNGLNNGDFNNGNGDDSMASEYLNDFDSDSNLDKVQVQLEGEPEAFGNGNEGENKNSFLDCDWGNIGDFDDFDRLFSHGESIFGNEMGGNEGPFLSQTSDVTNCTSLQSVPLPNLQFSGDQASGNSSSSVQINGIPPGGNETEEKAENDYKELQHKSRKKSSEKGKNKMTVLPLNNAGQVPVMHHASLQTPSHMQVNPSGFPFPGFGYPGYSFPGIPILPKPVPASSSYNKPVDKMESPVVMTPQEKIEKLRRRQQMQALLAIQQQQQQLGHQVSGNDNLVPQISSPRNQNQNRNQNPDSLASSALLEGSSNKGLTSVNTVQDVFLKDEAYIEETIYHQLQETLAKMDVRVRMCIRDSLLRLARSAMERQQVSTSDTRSTAGDNDNHHHLSAKDETDISRTHSSNPTIRFPTMIEEETGTNRIDRTVAHLLFHNLSEKSASLLKEEAPFSPVPISPCSFNSDSEVSGAKLEENQQNGNEMEVDMKAS